MCLFNVVLCLMLGLLSIFFNALCRVMFNFLFTANIILVVTLSIISMRFYVRGKLYPLSNLIIYNPFALFPVTWDNLLCTIVSCRFILLIICFCPSISRVEFSSSNSSSLSQFEFLRQWHFLSSYCDIVVRFILMFALSFNFNGYFLCCKKTRSYHLGFWCWSCPSERESPLCNVCILIGISACFKNVSYIEDNNVLSSIYQVPNVNSEGMFWTITNGRY